MTQYNDQAIVLLAAGNSSRMGTSKQMLNMNGKTLLEHTVSCAVASHISNILVVLGANVTEHKAVLTGSPVSVLVNPDWAKGMGCSLKAGLKKIIDQYNNVQAVMVIVCDQPLLTSNHIDALAEVYQKRRPLAIASQYNGTYGVPAIFDRSIFSHVLMISDHSGAREVLQKMERELVMVPFDGGEIDLDTPQDYRDYMNRGH